MNAAKNCNSAVYCAIIYSESAEGRELKFAIIKPGSELCFNHIMIISELQHLLLTSIIAIFLFWRYRDWRLIPICFLFGFFIDVDHLFDYFVSYGFNFNLSCFFDVCSYIEQSKKVYVLFHGWEYIAIFWLIAKWIGKRKKIKGLEWAVSLSYFGHIFLDNFSFSHHPFSYFFIYRLLNNFSLKSFNNI